MGQLEIGIFHGFARAGQNGTVSVTVRTAGAEGSDFSRNLTTKFLAPCYIVLRPFRSFSWSGIRSYSIISFVFISSYYLFYYFQYFKCKYIHQSIRNLSLYFH